MAENDGAVLREKLVLALKADVIGPFDGNFETTELLELPPSPLVLGRLYRSWTERASRSIRMRTRIWARVQTRTSKKTRVDRNRSPNRKRPLRHRSGSRCCSRRETKVTLSRCARGSRPMLARSANRVSGSRGCGDGLRTGR